MSTTLHTVNRSPFEHGALAACLARARPGSAVLLIEDGVLGALAGSPHADRLAAAAADGVEVFALGPDLDARGIEAGRLAGCIEVVDYAGFVALACRFAKTATWT